MRILIIDDHPLFRAGLDSLVRSLCNDIEVLQAASVAMAEQYVNAGVDLVLLDLNLPDITPPGPLPRVKALFDAASVVVVSAKDDVQTIHDCVAQGASGFIPKDTEPGVTSQALRLVLAQGIYLPPKAIQRDSGSEGVTAPAQARPHLSPRQQAVLKGLLQGKPNKLIARDIGIAEGTVKAHLWAIYQVLGAQSRAQAMVRALQLGFFTV